MKVLYAGSFNPWHRGHQHVYDMACKCFGKDNVIVGIGSNPSKVNNGEFVKWTMKPLKLNVQHYSILTADFCRLENIELIIRGIRPGRSLEYEEDLMFWNRRLGGPETIFIPTPPEINQISSTIIRELASYDIWPGEFMANEDVMHRWMRGKKPEKEILFGKTCTGKSTYLKVNYKRDRVLDMDKEIWHHIDLKTNGDKVIQNKIKKHFIAGEMELFKQVFQQELLPLVDWKELLSGHDVIDFAALGAFMSHMPAGLLAEYRLIKVSTSQEQRLKNMESRGWRRDMFNKLDNLYVEPEYWDEELNLK
jgi:pantetheine-phosphate adenylyltransferase